MPATGRVPLIGVAKTAFRGATHAIKVHRGSAARPLYVTAVGVPAEQAATFVRRMARAVSAAQRAAPSRLPVKCQQCRVRSEPRLLINVRPQAAGGPHRRTILHC
jgi:hypothetical protein